MFERVQQSSVHGTETSTFRVRIGQRSWVTVCNLYCPPSRSHSGSPSQLDLDKVPSSPETIIFGDFNAHDPLWDHRQPKDSRGEALLDWTFERDMNILNDGSHTRLNTRSSPLTSPPPPPSHTKPPPPANQNKTEGKSSPDITIAGSKWSSKCSWFTVEGIGSSDHLPICINIGIKVSHGSVFKGQVSWKSSGVDWKQFTDGLDSAMETQGEPPADATVQSMIADFHSAMIEVAKRTVGTIKPGRRTRSWETPAVRAAIRKRNRLRHAVKSHRKEWLEACREAQEAITEAKTDAWRQVLEECTQSTDDKKLWRVIKNLNGTPESNSPNEAMNHGGRLITSDKRKADIFAIHYANVSDLGMSKCDRDENRQLKAYIRKVDTRDPGTPDFTMSELRNGISKMKSRGAPGPDNIPPTFLKHLGPRASSRLLRIFNVSLRNSEVPQMWRNATIIPLLKSGKSPSELASYRPISLTSCIMKLLERMISENLPGGSRTISSVLPGQTGVRKSSSPAAS